MDQLEKGDKCLPFKTTFFFFIFRKPDHTLLFNYFASHICKGGSTCKSAVIVLPHETSPNAVSTQFAVPTVVHFSLEQKFLFYFTQPIWKDSWLKSNHIKISPIQFVWPSRFLWCPHLLAYVNWWDKHSGCRQPTENFAFCAFRCMFLSLLKWIQGLAWSVALEFAQKSLD